MTSEREIVIVGAARTPMGAFQGGLARERAPALGAAAISAALEHAGLAADRIDEIFMGCVLPAGLGQAPARQAALEAGLPESVPATTVNKVCGSGMQAVIFGPRPDRRGQRRRHRRRRHGEHVQRALPAQEGAQRRPHRPRHGLRPYVPRRARGRLRQGPRDGHASPRTAPTNISSPARRRTITRIEIADRAKAAIAVGGVRRRDRPVTVPAARATSSSTTDEQPGKGEPDKIPTLKPAFAKDGTITAATTSSISDGAAALVLTAPSRRRGRGRSAARADRRPRRPCAGAG